MTASRTMYGTYFPYGTSVAVRNMQYAADVPPNGLYLARFGAPLALSANGLMASAVMVNGSAVTITTVQAGAGSATAIGYNGMVPFDSTTVFGGWGRNITAVASAANARVLTVTGYDYLGQLMKENLTMNGTTTVQGLKAFAWVTSLSWASDTDTTTVNVGWGNKFGLPYAGQSMLLEQKNGAVAANAGTFTAALADATTATATNADVRGTYLPVTVIPDGTNTFEVLYGVRDMNLHGNAQYSG